MISSGWLHETLLSRQATPWYPGRQPPVQIPFAENLSHGGVLQWGEQELQPTPYVLSGHSVERIMQAHINVLHNYVLQWQQSSKIISF